MRKTELLAVGVVLVVLCGACETMRNPMATPAAGELTSTSKAMVADWYRQYRFAEMKGRRGYELSQEEFIRKVESQGRMKVLRWERRYTTADDDPRSTIFTVFRSQGSGGIGIAPYGL